MSPIAKRLTGIMLVCFTLVLAGCGSSPSVTPTAVSTPKVTQIPDATVGPLAQTDIPSLGLTMLTPSTWKAPVALNDTTYVISPNGSTDTSATAGPFILIGDAEKIARSRLNFSFRRDVSDPRQQLDALMAAINFDAPSFTAAAAYYGAKYPGAVSVGFARDNELNIILLDTGDSHWLYIGTQAPERYFAYYNDSVFKPAIASITPKTR